MPTDSAFWGDLEAQFRALPDAARDLRAMRDSGQWTLYGGGGQATQRKRLQETFRSLARRAAIAAGVPTRANALDGWFDLLRQEGPYFHAMPSSAGDDGGILEQLVLASTEYCAERATRSFELETAAETDDALLGLRRDRYPFCYWLYDHSHEPASDPKEELDYWKKHVWQGFHVLIENYEGTQLAEAGRHEKLISATSGLSYDLAVVQANYVIDRGLRGEDAIQTFRKESESLLEELESAWRASSERLGLLFDDDAKELKGVAQPFHRVRDDLRRLLAEVPAIPNAQRPKVEPDDWGAERRAAVRGARHESGNQLRRASQ
jgi:hypothetical protein